MDRNKTKQIVPRITIAILMAIYPVAALAVSPKPNFPSCVNPTGSVVASYASGTHGIPGDQASYTGKDVVYSLGEGNHTQCLCTTDGKGIQTNWWKTGSLTEEELSELKAQGWIYIPDGSLWGLEAGTYMAKNSTYSCTSGGSSTSSSSSSDSGSGGVQGTSTRIGQVLGLATTGNIPSILGFFGLSILAFSVFKKLNK